MVRKFSITKRNFINLGVLNKKHNLHLSEDLLASLKERMITFFEEKAPTSFTSKEAALLISILINEAFKPSFILERFEQSSYDNIRIRSAYIFLGRYSLENNQTGYFPNQEHQVLFGFINSILMMIHNHCSDYSKVL